MQFGSETPGAELSGISHVNSNSRPKEKRTEASVFRPPVRKKAASSFYYLTRFDGTVCTAGLHSMRSNGEWLAGLVFKCDHDLLSHLCFDYGTYASEDKEISFILVSTKQQNIEIKVELYPEFPSVAGPVSVLSAR